jgi:hypothetical protein
MSAYVEISPASIDAIARRVHELGAFNPAGLAVTSPTVDVWLDREQAAVFLQMKLRTFDRKRKLHAIALKPCDEHPLRWSRNALDVFKLTRGAPLHGRAGRRPKQQIAA